MGTDNFIEEYGHLVTQKDSFVIYDDSFVFLEDMTDIQIAQYYKAIARFKKTGKREDLDDPVVSMAYKFVTKKMVKDAIKYAERCERNRKNGAKGGDTKAANAREEASSSENKQTLEKEIEEASASDRYQTLAKPSESSGYDVMCSEVICSDVIKDKTLMSKPPGEAVQSEPKKEPRKQSKEPLKYNDPLFAEFWEAYPKKQAKGEAWSVWKKIRPAPDLLKLMLRSVADAKQSEDWKKEEGKYIPQPAKWLRWEHWLNEYKKEPDFMSADYYDTPEEWEGMTLDDNDIDWGEPDTGT